MSPSRLDWERAARRDLARQEDPVLATPRALPISAPSERQLNYIRSLRRRQGLPDAPMPATRRGAKQAISRLLAQEKTR